ncbi:MULTISPECIES: hypothetical protein [unclassified Paraflavitalea]|uniref:hypothetical protein n=1 Tax=unclassified Paraflavitalea TaxID=2798305 RepID=UPI003D34A626
MASFCRFLFVALLLVSLSGVAQPARSVKLINSYPAFPDSLRSNGHHYDGKHYPLKEHYNDSTMLVVFPANFKLKKQVDIVIWFHGWFNNIDSANNYFKLKEQFLHSNRDAVLVIPEMAKNAPDSYGGKFEDSGYFNLFMNSLLSQLASQQKRSFIPKVQSLVLAGHSGAYRVIAKIASNQPYVKEILLFDGMYGQVPLFMKWLHKTKSPRFINLYTHEGGGTDEMSDTLRVSLKQAAIPYADYQESELKASKFGVPVVFIETKRGHNEIIASPDYFELFLLRSVSLKPLNKR